MTSFSKRRAVTRFIQNEIAQYFSAIPGLNANRERIFLNAVERREEQNKSEQCG